MAVNKVGNILLTFDIAEDTKAYASFWWRASCNGASNVSTVFIDTIYFNHYGKAGEFLLNADMYLNNELFCSLKNGKAVITEPKKRADVTTDTFPETPFSSDAITFSDSENKTATLKIDAKFVDTVAHYECSASSYAEINISDYSQISSTNSIDLYIGQAYSVILDSYSPSYKYSIKYSFGELSGYINSAGFPTDSEQKLSGQVHTFRVPTSFYSQIPDSSYDICTLTVYTYSGDTLLGYSDNQHYTRVFASTCAPTLTATVVDSNESTLAVTGDENTFIKYQSSALVTVAATSQYSSNIASITANGVPAINGSAIIQNIDSDTIRVIVTDTRGVTASRDIRINLIPYIMLTGTATAKRVDPTSGDATLVVTGNYYNDKLGDSHNELTLTCYVLSSDGIAIQSVPMYPVIVSNSYSATVALSGLDYDQSYTIEVTAKDKVSTIIARSTVKQGIPIFEWGKNDFTVNKELRIKSADSFIIGGRMLLDYLHPVGSYYWSSDPTSPETLFGGKWNQIKDTFILAAGDTYNVNETGGSASHTMVQEEMPNHYHMMYISDAGDAFAESKETTPAYIGAIKNSVIEYNFDIGVSDTVPVGMTAFKGGVENEDGTFSAKPIDTMPPYRVAYVWERIE